MTPDFQNDLLRIVVNFLNLLGTVGVLAYVIKLEHRITKLETHIEHVLDHLKHAPHI